PEACEKAASKLAEEGLDAAGNPYDVTKEAQVADTVNVIQKQYGRFDILVNNAGIQHVAPIEEFPTVTFEQLIKVMLTAPFIAMKHVFP
ncbi:SDR family NAD(P)-dependent oxidoreductase, partial [Bacillus subtilis]|uniref:SDR family NAD(P)-dependent oxidoreductase n=1 Tax=Bacillus subtilis TaxID=1423 RepID=UPI0024AD2310